MYNPGDTVTSLQRQVEFDDGRHHRAKLGFILMSTDLAAEADFFYASIWECVVTSAPVRQAALDFVLRHFNKRQSMEDQLHFMGTNIEMLVRI